MNDVIKDSIGQYGKDLERYSHCVAPDFNVETIHHFRTTTKKLRSLLRWQNIPKHILPSSFAKIYHASGDLRNSQLLLTSLNEEKSKLPEFMLWLATSIGKQEKAWNKLFNEEIFQKLQHNLSRTAFQQPDRKFLQLFFTKRIQKMKIVAKRFSPADETLHEIRKMVKDMQYIKQWCRKNWVTGSNLTKKFSLLQLKKLGKLAGDFNDKRTGLLLITAYLGKERDEKSIKATRLVKKKHEVQKSILKKQLLESIVEFCEGVQPPYFPAINRRAAPVRS